MKGKAAWGPGSPEEPAARAQRFVRADSGATALEYSLMASPIVPVLLAWFTEIGRTVVEMPRVPAEAMSAALDAMMS